MENCIFCKIAAGEIPSTKVYEDERVLAFRDIDPQAPVHVLLIPKKHFADILECDSETFAYMQKIGRGETNWQRMGMLFASNIP